MGKQKQRQQAAESSSVPHRLLVYYNLGKRYRPPAVLLIVMGLLAFLPLVFPELENEAFDPEALAVVGGVVVLVGVAFWLFATLAMRRAYVMCRPDLLVIRAPFYRTLLSYRRIKDVRAEPVRKVFADQKLKGMGKPLVEPLLGLMAVVVIVKSWPKPKKRLQRFFSPYMFSPREGEEAWVFVVPNHNMLVRELDEFRLRKLDEDRGKQGYEDPIERLKHFSR